MGEMGVRLEDSRYSFPFLLLIFFGAWVYKTGRPWLVNVIVVHKLTLIGFAFWVLYLMLLDLYQVLGDIKKVSFNLCYSTILAAILFKNLITVTKSEMVNELRENLFKDESSRTIEEHIFENEFSYKIFKLLTVLIILVVTTFVPLWLCIYYFSYLWGPRELPLPLVLPFDVDIEDPSQYNKVFALEAIFGFAGLVYFVCLELSTFSLLIQIDREFRIFLLEIPKISELYETSETNGRNEYEFNPLLRKKKAKTLMRILLARQQKLMRYIEMFEEIYNVPMVIEIVGFTALAAVIGMQCTLALDNSDLYLSINITYQLAYVSTIICDLFLLAVAATRISTVCEEVGNIFYYTSWYNMELDLQKDICMGIRRSQNHPRFTTGKMADLDLNAFLHAMRNVYSFIALFRQMQS